MKQKDIQALVKELIQAIPSHMNGADKADIYALLGAELGLTHLLMPEAVPDQSLLLDLPDKAPELYEDRANKREKPCDFIARVYKPWLSYRDENGQYVEGIARHHILHLDKKLYHALKNWLYRNDMPDWLDLPTKQEINDRALERLGLKDGDTLPYPSYYKGLKDKLRLYNAARNRR
jgi:hypothetical protein